MYQLQRGVVWRQTRSTTRWAGKEKFGKWERLPSRTRFKAISVVGGQVWGVDTRGVIRRYPGNANWHPYPGSGFTQMVGAPKWNGVLYGLKGGFIYRFNPKTRKWWKLPSHHRFRWVSAVGGQVWGVDTRGVVRRYPGRAKWDSHSSGGFTQVIGSARWNGTLYGIKNRYLYVRKAGQQSWKILRHKKIRYLSKNNEVLVVMDSWRNIWRLDNGSWYGPY